MTTELDDSMKDQDQLSLREKVGVFVVLLAWLVCLTSGAVIDTRTIRDAISVELGADEAVLLAQGEARRMEALARISQRARGLADNASPRVEASSLPAVSAAPAETPVLLPPKSFAPLPYRSPELGAAELVGYMVVAVACYIVPNIALLSVFSSLLGAFGSRARLVNDPAHADGRDRTNPYLSAAIRGFTAYVIIISGMLAIVEAPFKDPSPEQYLRLAGFVSLFAFLLSYDPRLYQSVLGGIRTRFSNGK